MSKNFLVGGAVLLFLAACSRSYPGTEPQGKPFPSVEASSLAGSEVEIPEFFKGNPTLALVGFVQDSQFDIDRWILGLQQLNTPIELVEIPAVQGFFPRMIQGKIDQGMRSGIPKEDWPIVFTVYRDSEDIARFLGTENPRNARVVLLDEKGVVRWFHDRGYSAAHVVELDKEVRELQKNGN